MKIIETIAQKFNLSPEDVLKSLELSQDYKQIDLLKALGIYSMFGTKEEHEEYIKSKLKNYHEQLASRENESKEKDKKIQELELQKSQTLDKLNNVVEKEIQKLNFYGNVKAQDLDFEALDFQNLKGSILNQAKQNNWTIKEVEEPKQQETTQRDTKVFSYGIVTKN
ncbi:hypothetical protein [Mycoplasmopsis gallinacea]|uniref:Uncharacterized protein n=1 Tax=Mycoplasmopsis gallinacea TaxID=29556 RepID=A0A449A2H4_9BACT|nr:hypothetical protein [Mycoplasmopsis gallinacea]VEU58403.1 Uncharacterised protein [Mycoplasmopsis gallinacea]